MTYLKTNTMSSNQAAAKLSALNKKRLRWQEGALRKSNDELYRLLEECLAFYDEVKGNRKLNARIAEELKERGLPVQANTSLATRIARGVFGDSGKRVYAYARVIEIASQELEGASMKEWLDEKGGVENVRRSQNGLSPQQVREEKLQAAKDYLVASASQGSIEVCKNARIEAAEAADVELVAAIIRIETDGSKTLVYTTDKLRALNNILTYAGGDEDIAAVSKLAQEKASKNNTDNQDAIEAVSASNKEAA